MKCIRDHGVEKDHSSGRQRDALFCLHSARTPGSGDKLWPLCRQMQTNTRLCVVYVRVARACVCMYVSASPAIYTTKPAAPTHIKSIAVVVYAHRAAAAA